MRYYYEDPLKAAWMQYAYGMKLEFLAESNGEMATWNRLWFYLGDFFKDRTPEEKLLNPHTTSFRQDKIYIHVDSLHLLKPQVGDFLSTAQYRKPWQLDDISVLEMFCRVHPEPLKGGFRIIERNATAFMWPEIEND